MAGWMKLKVTASNVNDYRALVLYGCTQYFDNFHNS